MADDQKPLAPKEEETQELPLTKDDFVFILDKLIERATVSGLRPLPVMATILAKRGFSLLDQVRSTAEDMVGRALTALETGDAKASKK